MKFEISAHLKYYTFSKGSIILNIKALKNSKQKIVKEHFTTSTDIKVKDFNELSSRNRLTSLNIVANQDLEIKYNALVDNNFEIIDIKKVADLNLSKLSPELLKYLHPSRYCQSDKLYRLANNKFGKKSNAFEKVMALTQWIYLNVEYMSGSTTSETSAYDTVTQQAGVCRDFAHLGIALCRALTIPARYFTGYAYQLFPQDFHACFEAYINGKWLLFDATRLIPLNGMVKIAHGRDAADAAVANIFGEVNFIYSNVSCNLVEDEFIPFTPDQHSKKAISYF